MIFGDAPANRTASWHPDSALRGSFSILSTCLITLSLCIWTAVHLNIPEHTKRKRKTWDPRGWITKQQWRKVGWLMMGVVAPEIIAYKAWHQRPEANRLTKIFTSSWGKQARHLNLLCSHRKSTTLNCEPRKRHREGNTSGQKYTASTPSWVDLYSTRLISRSMRNFFQGPAIGSPLLLGLYLR